MQPLNFSTQCLENWREQPARSWELRRLVGALAGELAAAPKYVLPAGGRPLEDFASISRMLPELQLPHPCVALEYQSAGAIGEHEVASGKRIALAWQLDYGMPAPLQELLDRSFRPRHSILVQSISYVDQAKLWIPILGMVEIHLDEGVARQDVATLDPQLVDLTRHRMLRQHGKTDTYSSTVYATCDTILDTYGPESASSIISADSSDEVCAALSFAALTICSNVRSEVLAAPAALNKKRMAAGKTPMFDVRVLAFDDEGLVRTQRQHGEPQGTHARPREHVRSGHTRRVASGKRVFIPRTLVNQGYRPGAPAPTYVLERKAGHRERG